MLFNFFKKVYHKLFKNQLSQAIIPEQIEKTKNPYTLYWYKGGWSDKKLAKNNSKYWKWEIEHNGFNPLQKPKKNKLN